MQKNIVVISLSNASRVSAAQHIADGLDFYFLDIDALLEYEITDERNVIEKCGIEYLNKLKKGILFRSTEYQKTCYTMSWETLLECKNYELFNNCVIILIDVDKQTLSKEIKDLKYYHNRLSMENMLSIYSELRNKLMAIATMSTDGTIELDSIRGAL